MFVCLLLFASVFFDTCHSGCLRICIIDLHASSSIINCFSRFATGWDHGQGHTLNECNIMTPCSAWTFVWRLTKILLVLTPSFLWCHCTEIFAFMQGKQRCLQKPLNVGAIENWGGMSSSKAKTVSGDLFGCLVLVI